MKTAYFDCFAGVSGDMFLGALIDAGLDPEALKEALSGLNLPGYGIEISKIRKNGITGTRFEVKTQGDQKCRHFSHIRDIIEQSSLPDSVKERSIQCFRVLGEAEAKIHGTTLEKIHFHEVGAVDSIIDMVGAVTALHLTGIEKVFASPVHVGTGFVQCMHGKIPLPAPAALEMLKGIPVFSTGIEEEITTPTGACLLKVLSEGFGPMGSMKIEQVGYGAGYLNLPIPNLLRVIIGST